jgi:hypothetical protein
VLRARAGEGTQPLGSGFHQHVLDRHLERLVETASELTDIISRLSRSIGRSWPGSPRARSYPELFLVTWPLLSSTE